MLHQAREAIDSDRPTLIGVVHLLPLPGSPRASALPEILDHARADLRAWFEGGADAVLVENFGDRPFHARRVPAVTVAALSWVLSELQRDRAGSYGVNVLRNDGVAALSLAAVHDLDFVRVNVLTGVAVTDQGLVHGEAARLLRLRASLGARARIFADVHVKHARPLVERPLEEEAEDALERGLADALLLTGPATGSPVDLDSLAELRARLPRAPIYLASGVDPRTVARTRSQVQGWIVGSWAKRGGLVDGSVDLRRVRELRSAADS